MKLQFVGVLFTKKNDKEVNQETYAKLCSNVKIGDKRIHFKSYSVWKLLVCGHLIFVYFCWSWENGRNGPKQIEMYWRKLFKWIEITRCFPTARKVFHCRKFGHELFCIYANLWKWCQNETWQHPTKRYEQKLRIQCIFTLNKWW